MGYIKESGWKSTSPLLRDVLNTKNSVTTFPVVETTLPSVTDAMYQRESWLTVAYDV